MRILFQVGDAVIERLGEGDAPTSRQLDTSIAGISTDGATVLTETGRWYDRLTGRRWPSDERGYRAIRSAAYKHATYDTGVGCA